jgi:glycosyltransferase involved in cell wall biosynthesis
LKIAAKVDPFDREYFVREIEPLLDHPLIEFIGEIDDAKKGFLGGALALLFLIAWPEPFGLVMIEAMACGTPVIAWGEGSVPEVIDHGVSGMIVSSVEEAIEAVRQIPS